MPKYLIEVVWRVTSQHEVEAENPLTARYAIGDLIDQEKLTLDDVIDLPDTDLRKSIDSIEEIEED